MLSLPLQKHNGNVYEILRFLIFKILLEKVVAATPVKAQAGHVGFSQNYAQCVSMEQKVVLMQKKAQIAQLIKASYVFHWASIGPRNTSGC